MPNKNKQKRVIVRNQSKPKAKATPFSDAGAIVGSSLGSMFNAPYLKGVGKWLGSGIGQIFGSGDYQIIGAQPAYNVLANGNQIPKFSSSKQTNIVCHREYLGDIAGTAAFNNNVYPLNPGISTTFPWLSTIAQNYQEYKFHGVIFEFRPLITDFVTNGAPGVVVMATNYNADAPPYDTKQSMENSEYAVSVKPTRELMHGVECATVQTVLPQLYVRSGNPPAGQDLRLYDLGNFQFATQTNPIQNLGELWVSYCVEFFKPILPTDVGGNVLSGYVDRGLATPAAPFGTVARTAPTGDLLLTIGTTSLTWFAQPGNYYYVSIFWEGSAAVAITQPTDSYVGLLIEPTFVAGTFQTIIAPSNGAVSLFMTHGVIFKCILTSPGFVTYTLSGGGVYPTNASANVLVTMVSTEIA